MKILLTGATGYIGSAVRAALLASGHDVTALVRDEKRADGGAVVGDMRDRALITRLAAGVDAVVATATPGDGTSAAADTDFVDAVLAGLRPGGTFLRTGGVWVHGAGDDLTEDTPLRPPALVAWRPAIDARVLAAPGIRALLIEPGIVHGNGAGIPRVIVDAEVTGDALRLVGPGTQHWTTVHVDDLAELYVTVLEQGTPATRYLGVSGDNPTVRELGEAAAHRRGLAGRVLAETAAATVARLGDFGAALLLDQRASGARARALGWKPSRPSLIAEIEAGAYDATAPGVRADG